MWMYVPAQGISLAVQINMNSTKDQELHEVTDALLQVLE